MNEMPVWRRRDEKENFSSNDGGRNGIFYGGCGSKADEKTDDTAKTEATDNKGSEEEETEIQVFIAASLKNVMDELAAQYNEEHPNVKITYNADSSGTLMTQIEEGYECDIFFSAAQKQMNQLEEDKLIVDGTRANVVNNQVVVVIEKTVEQR